MCMWSGMRCPSEISTPFSHKASWYFSKVFSVFVINDFPSTLVAYNVYLHNHFVRKANDTYVPPPLRPNGCGDLNNRYARREGFYLQSKKLFSTPHSGWFIARFALNEAKASNQESGIAVRRCHFIYLSFSAPDEFLRKKWDRPGLERQ